MTQIAVAAALVVTVAVVVAARLRVSVWSLVASSYRETLRAWRRVPRR